MAEFKPMVKMETTEPSVELKLKKGGHVNMKKAGKAENGFKKMADGGSCSEPTGALQALMKNPALIGRPAVNALVRSPGKPSMAARKAAMKAPVKGMKKGGKADGGMMGGLPTQGPMSSDKVAQMAALKMPQSATPAPSATNNRTMAMPPAIARHIQKVQSPDLNKPMSPIPPAIARYIQKMQSPDTNNRTMAMSPAMARLARHANHRHRPLGGGTTPIPKMSESEFPRGGSPIGGKNPNAKPTPIPQEFLNFDKNSTVNIKKGGSVEGKKSDTAQDKAMIKKAFKQHDAQEHMGGKGTKLAIKKGGSVLAGPQKGGVRENESIRMSATTRTTSGKKDPGYENYKKGGSAKKAYATGGRVESGSPVAMPQGRKKPQSPIRIDQLTGTYKKGGCVKMKDGGNLPPPKDMSKGAYDRFYADEKADNEAMSEAILGFPSRLVDKMKELFSSSKPAGSVTKTEKSVTVAPGKKNGGRC
jgi:hypothetical protein